MKKYDEIMSEEFKKESADAGAYDIPKTLANHLCDILTRDGHDTNWGYSCGVILVRTKGDVAKVVELFEFYSSLYRNFAEEKIYEDIPTEEKPKDERIAVLEKELEEAMLRNQDIVDTLNEYRKQDKQLKAKINVYESRIKKLSSAIEEFEKRVETAKAETQKEVKEEIKPILEAIQKRVDENYKENERLKRENDRLKKENADLLEAYNLKYSEKTEKELKKAGYRSKPDEYHLKKVMGMFGNEYEIYKNGVKIDTQTDLITALERVLMSE